MQHFASVLRMSTPNPVDIPLLLRTREDPEMEEEDRQLMVDKPREKNAEALHNLVMAHNDAVESLEETFNEMSDGLLKAIRVNKYVVKSKPQSTQSQKFKYIESGMYTIVSVILKVFYTGRKGRPKKCNCTCGTDVNEERWKPNLGKIHMSMEQRSGQRN
ncbi:hypothetical protein PsorP6_010200 [Peronosclerospora sorghi]|uniref:Uncharacterized protein n=1 Tax=Peronosclerospora sorghi TaxID=230839 RepID=A0ACC0VV40_9STRA|nr:hypothetical protein PsorP6_010200 [Peronosclerospora sorghi]